MLFPLQAELDALKSDDDSLRSVPTKPHKDQSQPGGTSHVLITLQERLVMYQQAHAGTVSSGDSSKARRLDRGLHVSLYQ